MQSTVPKAAVLVAAGATLLGAGLSSGCGRRDAVAPSAVTTKNFRADISKMPPEARQKMMEAQAGAAKNAAVAPKTPSP